MEKQEKKLIEEAIKQHLEETPKKIGVYTSRTKYYDWIAIVKFTNKSPKVLGGLIERSWLLIGEDVPTSAVVCGELT